MAKIHHSAHSSKWIGSEAGTSKNNAATHGAALVRQVLKEFRPDQDTQYDAQQIIVDRINDLTTDAAELLERIGAYGSLYGECPSAVAARLAEVGELLLGSAKALDPEYLLWLDTCERDRAWDMRNHYNGESSDYR